MMNYSSMIWLIEDFDCLLFVITITIYKIPKNYFAHNTPAHCWLLRFTKLHHISHNIAYNWHNLQNNISYRQWTLRPTKLTNFQPYATCNSHVLKTWEIFTKQGRNGTTEAFNIKKLHIPHHYVIKPIKWLELNKKKRRKLDMVYLENIVRLPDLYTQRFIAY